MGLACGVHHARPVPRGYARPAWRVCGGLGWVRRVVAWAAIAFSGARRGHPAGRTYHSQPGGKARHRPAPCDGGACAIAGTGDPGTATRRAPPPRCDQPTFFHRHPLHGAGPTPHPKHGPTIPTS